MPEEYSRSEQLADDLMFDELSSEAGSHTSSGDTYATEHVPKAKKKKKDDLSLRSYYFEGIEKLSPAQLSKLDKLTKQFQSLVAELKRLGLIDTIESEQKASAIKEQPRVTYTPEQVAENQRKRIAGIDISKFVKAGWQLESDQIYAGLWNPEQPMNPDGTATGIAVWVKGLAPSRTDPNRSNLKQTLSGEQEPEHWEKGLAEIFMTVPHATEEQWQTLTQTYLSPGTMRKDKPPTTKKANTPKKKPAKRSSKASVQSQEEVQPLLL